MAVRCDDPHPDTGWDDYADGWRVLDMDGNELGMRVLHHPHVDEQPFTRSLSGGADSRRHDSGADSGPRQCRMAWSEDTTVVDLN